MRYLRRCQIWQTSVQCDLLCPSEVRTMRESHFNHLYPTVSNFKLQQSFGFADKKTLVCETGMLVFGCMEWGKLSWPVKKTPVTAKVPCQHSEFMDKIFNSCLDSATALPCRPLCYFTFYLGCGLSKHLVCPGWCLFDFRLHFSLMQVSWECESPKLWILQYNSLMHFAGQKCHTHTYTQNKTH